MRKYSWLALIVAALGSIIAIGIAAAAPPWAIQQVSSDPYTNPTSQHETEVEPDTFAFGDTVVSAFQAGRFFSGGGASNIRFATSFDAGETWTNGFLPSLTVLSSPAGAATRATDPSVAYDSTHGVWLIASLNCFAEPCSAAPTAIRASRSTDGVTWGAPVTVATGDYDKDWIVCDNWASSLFLGHCYAAWIDVGVGSTGSLVSTSSDGGLTWGPPVAATGMGLGVQPVVQPNGNLVIVGLTAVDMGAIRSTDGGATFAPIVSVDPVSFHAPTGMRALPNPSVEVDAAGRIYAVWPDCRFRTSCSANDIAMSTSDDGLSWSTVTRVPIDRTDSGIDHFIPGIAVNATTSGTETDIAITYYYFPVASCTAPACELNVGFISTNNAGVRWTKPKQLNDTPMALSWIADTDAGRMVGDYISTSFAGNRAVPTISVASAPTGGTFHQAMFAASIPVRG